MINYLTDKTRQAMLVIAKGLDRFTGSRLTPNMVTGISFFGHIWVFSALIRGHFFLAGVLIVIFGLMDALDGALARVQKNSSASGMMLDANSDRVKEFLIYFGFILMFADNENLAGVAAAGLALGGSFMVSYVKAKGETAVASEIGKHAVVNRVFADGLMQYQVRMAIVVIGLITNHTVLALAIVAVGAWLTAFQRFIVINDKLEENSQKVEH